MTHVSVVEAELARRRRTILGWLGRILLILAALLLTGLLPVWRGSGWPLLRRLHYTAYALALPWLCAQLWYWNLFGAPLI